MDYESGATEGGESGPGGQGRRTVLALGAATATFAVTIRPALAATTASALTCQISVPDRGHGGSYVAADGTLVAANTPGAFPPAPRPLTGEEVKAMLKGGPAPAGIEYERARAYTNYIRRLQRGQSGFTCFASLQSPR